MRSGLRHLWRPLVLAVISSGLPSCAALVQAQSEDSLSVTEAAKQARDRQEHAGQHPRVITNEDLEKLNQKDRPLRIVAPRRRSKPEFPPSPSIFTCPRVVNAAQVGSDQDGTCGDLAALELRRQIEEAKERLDLLRRVNDARGQVISDDDFDPQYFRPGQSGLNVGGPPRSDAQSQSPTRIQQRAVQDRLTLLQRQLLIVCEPADVADIRRRLDQAEDDLDFAQRKYALDREAYYQQAASPAGAEGNAWLDSERQQLSELDAQVDALREELASAQAARANAPGGPHF